MHLPATHATLADLTGLFFTTFEWADLLCYQLFLPALDVSMIVHHVLYGAMGLPVALDPAPPPTEHARGSSVEHEEMEEHIDEQDDDDEE